MDDRPIKAHGWVIILIWVLRQARTNIAAEAETELQFIRLKAHKHITLLWLIK